MSRKHTVSNPLYVQDHSRNDFVEPDRDMYQPMIVREHVTPAERMEFAKEWHRAGGAVNGAIL